MKMTHKHVEALNYVASGDYRRPGGARPELNKYVDEIRKEGLVCVKVIGDSSKLSLTIRGNCVLASLT